jgi:hypothetical protein
MIRYRTESSPSETDNVLSSFLDRQLFALETSLDSVNFLDPLSVVPSKPQYGQFQYFTSSAAMLWGEGPYCYTTLGGIDLWYPMFPPVMNTVQGVIAPGSLPVAITAAWAQLISLQIDVRPFGHAAIKAMLNAESIAFNQNVNIEYRARIDGGPPSVQFQPFWSVFEHITTPSAGFTTTLVGATDQTLVGTVTTHTVSVEARSTAPSLVQVIDGFLELEEKK